MAPDPQARPIDRVFAAYALVGALALLFPHHTPIWPALVALHLLAAAAALYLPPVRRLLLAAGRAWPRLSRVVHDWYALALVPALYTELAILNQAVWNGHYFDAAIQRVEIAIFGGLPSRELATAFPYPVLSEFLHTAYLSYYVILFGPSLFLYLAGRVHAFRVVTFGVVFMLLLNYVAFIFYPVQGPRYLFPPPGGPLRGEFVNRLTHWILEHGSARGAAFPSSHMSVVTVQTVMAYRYLRRAFPLLVVAVLGVGVGAVYSGFHYAVDMVAGALVALVLGLLVPRAYVLLARQEPPVS
ncbi:MAG: phosphatase PAP2 family protein [Gemmatimonadota bacterium]